MVYFISKIYHLFLYLLFFINFHLDNLHAKVSMFNIGLIH